MSTEVCEPVVLTLSNEGDDRFGDLAEDDDSRLETLLDLGALGLTLLGFGKVDVLLVVDRDDERARRLIDEAGSESAEIWGAATRHGALRHRVRRGGRGRGRGAAADHPTDALRAGAWQHARAHRGSG